MGHRTLYIYSIFVTLSISALHAQTDPPPGCPAYTHKEVVTVGQRSNLPDGWYVFAKAEQGAILGGVFAGKILPGIYKSSLRDNNPKVIPGTENDPVETMEISDDGEWIVYINRTGSKLSMTRVDGSAKVVVPTSGTPQQCGFYRQSPFGSEIWYMVNSVQLRAVKVTWSASAPSFGTDRVVADLSGTDKIFGQGAGQTSICKDQIFGRIKSTSRFMTIPDGGRGIAKFDFPATLGLDPGKDTKPGCGETMSHDGAYCLANPGNAGSGGCVPDPAGGMDHKGFIVTPFVRAGQIITHRDLYLQKGYSINWCPKEYRFGTYSEMEFHEYYLGNNPQYAICVQRGSKSPSFGVWLVHWKTNTWIQLTDKTIVADGPTVFFTGATPVRHSPQPRHVPGSTAARAAAHDLQGRKIACGVPIHRGLLIVESGATANILFRP